MGTRIKLISKRYHLVKTPGGAWTLALLNNNIFGPLFKSFTKQFGRFFAALQAEKTKAINGKQLYPNTFRHFRSIFFTPVM